jgi:YbbR domain-containing protein
VRIFNNLLYKFAALLIACVLWAATQGLRSTEQGFDVPVALEDIPNDVVVVEQTPREINVSVVGSRAALLRADRHVVRYPVSLEGVKPGEARFTIDDRRLADAMPRGATIGSRSPSTIVLRLEQRIRKRVRVKPDVSGEPAPGYELAAVHVMPDVVELEGARSELRVIREASTDRVDISGLERSEERPVRLVIGAPHVWRAGDDEPINIRIEVRPTAAELPEAELPGAALPKAEQPEPDSEGG